MGSQGDIHLIYGTQVDAQLVWEPKPDTNPVVYSVNGHTCCDDEDLIGYTQDSPDEPFEDEEGNVLTGFPEKIEFFNGVVDRPKLSIVVLGHYGRYGQGDMGSRGFDPKRGKALIGFCVGSVYDVGHAAKMPPVSEITKLEPVILAQAHLMLGLTIPPADLGLHLYFDGLNGF